MPTIILETLIYARAEECFDLIRNSRIYAEPLPAIFSDLGLDQTVTFNSKVFGIAQELTVKVIEFERPTLLVDEMVKGPFKSFKHIHEFLFVENGTVMRDTLVWESPLGILGKLVDNLFLEKHLKQVVTIRNARLKAVAEITQK